MWTIVVVPEWHIDGTAGSEEVQCQARTRAMQPIGVLGSREDWKMTRRECKLQLGS